ncbi:nucleotidyltransferase domain-containing protein [Peribacillus loiseleuriae]|uniref:nucleotidyltransferase domain-containing protein n=1 Tax=Peribacillus loiseleuriae TaxID=1679170 RepID=UPI0038097AE1
MREASLDIDKIKIYLFGSFGKALNPSDIDLLLLFDKKAISIPNILSLRKKIAYDLSKITSLPVDISILSFTEEKEVKFIECENARELNLF